MMNYNMSTKITTIKLAGLTCTACQKLAGKRIKIIADVEEVNVDISGETQIKAIREISEDEVKQVLKGTHYTVAGEK